MSKVKKIMALIMAVAMVLGMSVATYAMPSDKENTQVKVLGVEQGLTVTAYQIIKYDESGQYKEVLTGTITKNTDGKLSPTAEDIQSLAQRTNELTNQKVLGYDENLKAYIATNMELEPGTWMVILTGSTEYLYNPVLVSLSVTAD